MAIVRRKECQTKALIGVQKNSDLRLMNRFMIAVNYSY